METQHWILTAGLGLVLLWISVKVVSGMARFALRTAVLLAVAAAVYVLFFRK